MTKLTPDRPIKRETWVVDRGRPILIEAFPFYCCVRVKGKQESHNVSWDAILDLGRKLDAREKLAQQQRRSA